MGTLELVATCGFALFFGWMYLSFYWLSCFLFQDMWKVELDFVQLFVFVGTVAGYLAGHCLGKTSWYRPSNSLTLVCEAVCCLLLPAVACSCALGHPTSLVVIGIVNFITGTVGAFLTVNWLEASSHIRISHFGRFTACSLVGGGALFVIASILPQETQPLFGALYGVASIGLLAFVFSRGNEAVLDRDDEVSSPLKFTLEVGPSFIMFGVMFGATFVFLFNYGVDSLFAGLCSVIPGGGVIVALALLKKNFGVTQLQRVLLCVTVFACIAVPFVPDAGLKTACSCLVLAAWAAHMATNYAILTRIVSQAEGVSVFRAVPKRLVTSAFGFALGWGIATVLTYFSAYDYTVFETARLIMAVLLVVVFMAFMPDRYHHGDEQFFEQKTIVMPELSESELFERRCESIAQLYQLSAREVDVLRLLARGRNASYIQSKLTISPHTVKSHIYNIYRKLDIHSQQKLMDFVEEYPIEQK